MKVVRLKVKAATKTCAKNHLYEEYQHLRNELIAANQENECLRATLAFEKKKTSESYNIAIKASADLGVRLARTMDERDEAREEADDLSIELMDRECRIEELERRVRFLEAALANERLS